jgi:hypothetical protein
VLAAAPAKEIELSHHYKDRKTFEPKKKHATMRCLIRTLGAFGGFIGMLS